MCFAIIKPFINIITLSVLKNEKIKHDNERTNQIQSITTNNKDYLRTFDHNKFLWVFVRGNKLKIFLFKYN